MNSATANLEQHLRSSTGSGNCIAMLTANHGGKSRDSHKPNAKKGTKKRRVPEGKRRFV